MVLADAAVVLDMMSVGLEVCAKARRYSSYHVMPGWVTASENLVVRKNFDKPLMASEHLSRYAFIVAGGTLTSNGRGGLSC